MPITFACQACRREIRVPDGTQGRKTQCPFCQAVQAIPGQRTSADPLGSGQPAEGSPGESANKMESVQGSPFSPQRQTADSENPFASPTTGQNVTSVANISLGELRQRLMIPSIVQLVFVVLGMLVASGTAVVLAIIATEANEPGMLGMVFMYGGSAVLHVPAIIGLVAAIRQSSISWAWVGFVMSVVPLTSCCSCTGVPIGIGIWGMIVLANPATRQLFPN